MKLFDLSGRTALVTGATRGIGRAIAEALAQAGAQVIISSRSPEACETTADEIRKTGGDARPLAAHIGEDSQLDRLADQAGQVDVLVCNAAVNPWHGPFLETPDQAFDKIVQVNIRANFQLCSRFIPPMRQRRDGVVLIVSSIAAFRGSTHLGMYAVSKAANIQMVRNLALACGEDQVRVNGIAPALVRTEFARALWDDAEKAQKVADTYALKRLGEPDDIAGAAVFLAARSGAWITGQTLVIDGGWSVTE